MQKRAQEFLDASEEDRANPNARAMLLRTAKAQLGTPYVSGGSKPGGFDCSGFVQWTYNQVGVKLPRTAREQSHVGRPVHANDMQVGDIVTFRHPKRGYHTGIYVGDGKFIHSPRQRTRIRVNSLDDPYFSSTFTGARRVSITSSDAEIASAEKMLEEYRVQEKEKRTTARSDKRTSKQKGRISAENRQRDKDKGRAASRQKDRKKDRAAQSDRRSSKEKAKSRSAGKTQDRSKEKAKTASKDKQKSSSKNKQKSSSKDKKRR